MSCSPMTPDTASLCSIESSIDLDKSLIEDLEGHQFSGTNHQNGELLESVEMASKLHFWLSVLESVFKAADYPEQHWAQMAQYATRGAASRWLRESECKLEDLSWNQFKGMMTDMSHTEIEKGHRFYLYQFLDLRLEPGMTAKEYTDLFSKLKDKSHANPSREWELAIYLHGLPPPMRREIEQKGCSSLATAIYEAEDLVAEFNNNSGVSEFGYHKRFRHGYGHHHLHKFKARAERSDRGSDFNAAEFGFHEFDSFGHDHHHLHKFKPRGQGIERENYFGAAEFGFHEFDSFGHDHHHLHKFKPRGQGTERENNFGAAEFGFHEFDSFGHDHHHLHKFKPRGQGTERENNFGAAEFGFHEFGDHRHGHHHFHKYKIRDERHHGPRRRWKMYLH